MLLTPILLALFAAPQEQAPASDADRCHAGLWNVVSESYRPDGSVVTTRASSTVSLLFDGRLDVAEYRDLAPDGRVLFRGISFHAWNRARTERTTLWAMLGDPGLTFLVEHTEDGVLVAEGAGHDAGGAFLETSATTFDDPCGYRFEMNRSYDDGATWRRPFNVIVASRLGDAPAAPTQLAPATRDAKLAAGALSAGSPVLDGLAELEARTEEIDGRTVRTIRFSARYANPDRWRTIVWELGELEADDESLPIPAK